MEIQKDKNVSMYQKAYSVNLSKALASDPLIPNKEENDNVITGKDTTRFEPNEKAAPNASKG